MSDKQADKAPQKEGTSKRWRLVSGAHYRDGKRLEAGAVVECPEDELGSAIDKFVDADSPAASGGGGVSSDAVAQIEAQRDAALARVAELEAGGKAKNK